MTMKVGLFITCLADLYRPSVGFAAVKLLEDAGCEIVVPEGQTCCGQPTFNSGEEEKSKHMAIRVIDQFYDLDYVVVPSGSCGAMIKAHYPELFEGDPVYGPKADDLSKRTFELTSFLADIMEVNDLDVRYDGLITYHDSCSGLRELGVKKQPRSLLAKVGGLGLREMEYPETCCGFGGTFCVKYPDISNKIVTDKCEDILKSGADTLVAGDMGCLLNMGGKLKRLGHDIKVRHVAEILAGMTDDADINSVDGKGS